jgi:uncharacterized protein
MRVGETTNKMPDLPESKKIHGKAKGTGAKKVAGQAAEVDFSQTLFSAAETSIVGSLDEILRDLDQQGERLVRTQNFNELEKYKDLVKAFIIKVTKDLYHLRSSDGGAGQTNQKVYVILQKVDLELDALTKQVLSKQKTQLKILERLDQIKGLLLDLYK